MFQVTRFNRKLEGPTGNNFAVPVTFEDKELSTVYCITVLLAVRVAESPLRIHKFLQ